jgi:hypothetical protein
MDEKITIIEGPPPTFEAVNEGWVLGLNESPKLAEMAITRLRTFNGPALVERCYRAWRDHQAIQLEFRTPEGLERLAPIVAARTIEVDEGQMLLLWVRLDAEEVELELGYEDDAGDESDDDNGNFPDL